MMPEELFGAAANATASDGMTKAGLQPNVYLANRYGRNRLHHRASLEMGSGSRTALPRIVRR